MAKKKVTSDDSMENEATGISGFGGHSLLAQQGRAFSTEAQDTDDGLLATLSELGIEDAEQILALAAIPDARAELETVLGSQTDSLQSLLNQLQNDLPADRVALVNKPATRDFGLGALVPTQEMMAAAEAMSQTLELQEPVGLPAAVNLIPYMSPIRNQGSRGTCVAFALTALNEYIQRRKGLIRDLSEQHLYYETKLIDGAPTACGTWQAKGMITLRTRGECREPIWPYNPNPPCNNHGPLPPAARPDGLNYRLALIAVPARNVLAYKTHMAKQRPVTISIPVYSSWYYSQETRRSGRITMRVGNEVAISGHAVCLVGYQDTPSSPGGGYFIVRNSWGTTGFGYESPYGKGYGIIPYQYITNDAYIGESFTAAVPGITAEDAASDEQPEVSSSTVTIEVKPNITITIQSS